MAERPNIYADKNARIAVEHAFYQTPEAAIGFGFPSMETLDRFYESMTDDELAGGMRYAAFCAEAPEDMEKRS